MRNQHQRLEEEIFDGLQMAAGGDDDDDAGPDTPADAPIGDKDAEDEEQKDPNTDEEE